MIIPSTLQGQEGSIKSLFDKKEKSNPIQVIDQIVFNGNDLYKSKKLLKKVKSKRKQIVDKRKLQNDVKLLFESGDFEDVTVKITDLNKVDKKGYRKVRITFFVEERPIIKRIDYKGNKKLKVSSFEERVQSEEDAPYDKFKVALDARSILEHYRDEGYANATVESYITLDPKKKKLILTFFIVEGERVLVQSMDVVGNKRFSDRKIRKTMETRRKKTYKNEVLSEDRRRITALYKNKGYLDVYVSTPIVNIDKERNRAQVTISIDEGPIYSIGDIHIASSTIFDEKELRKSVTLKPGKLFSQEKLDGTQAALSSKYADKGYLRTQVFVDPRRRTEEGLVDFEISFEESTVVYVDGIYVDGNTYTKSYVIRREVLLAPGDIFSAGKLRRSVEKIYNLGFLDDVQVDVQQPRDPNLADLIFSVKEGKPGIFSAGAGFSSVDRFVGTLQVQHTNLFGKAQRLNAQYEFGGRRQNFNIGWSDPWFLGYRMTGGVDLFNTVRRRDFPGNFNAFRERREGVSFRLGPRLSDKIGLLFGYTVENTEIFDVEDEIKEDLFPTFGISKEDAVHTDSVEQLKSSFVSEVAYDTRDNRFDASRGSRNAVSFEVSGGPFGGNIHYYKPQVTSSWYFPTFWKFVFTTRGRIAWANHFSPSVDLPTSERFFLGGADDVRGYDTNSIAPRIETTGETGILEIRSVPGRVLAVFNAEYKFPIIQERGRTIFQGAFFVDAGGNWENTEDVTFTTGTLDRRMKAGAGFGFRFKTPVFPIRLDFAIPLNPRNSDSSRQGDSRSLQPYFTIGNIF